MMKCGLKDEKGITLMTLAVTITLLVIITGILAVKSHASLETANLSKLENDIEILDDRIASFFVKNEKLPIYEGDGVLTKSQLSSILNDMSVNDGDNYYTIDIDALDNVTLNYGNDYKNLTNDRYIINAESHVVYYLKGVFCNSNEYHTIGKNPIISY